MSETYQSLSHSKWDCKYHVVFVPNGVVEPSSARRVGNGARSSTRWRGKRNARSSKAT